MTSTWLICVCMCNLGLKLRQFKNPCVAYRTCRLVQFVTADFDWFQTVNSNCVIIQYSVYVLVEPVSEHKSRLKPESYCVREQKRPSYEFQRHIVNMEDTSTSLVSNCEQSIKWKFIFTYSAKAWAYSHRSGYWFSRCSWTVSVVEYFFWGRHYANGLSYLRQNDFLLYSFMFFWPCIIVWTFSYYQLSLLEPEFYI